MITKEYPEPWEPGKEPYYPMNDERNTKLYEAYQELAKSRPEVIFGGRLGLYRYLDMDKTIRAALDCVRAELSTSG